MNVDVIERLVRKSEESDRMVPWALMFVPPILMFFGILFILGGLNDPSSLSFGLILLVLGTVVGVYLFYILISRRNTHFERTAVLYESISNYLNSHRLKDTVMRMKSEQGDEKNPVIWIVIYFLSNMIPFIGLLVTIYIFHFLNRDFVKHDRNERIFLEQLSDILPVGDSIKLSKIGKFPERNTIVYTVLTIITLGLFEIYWIYTLINDPNEHFKDHRLVEMKILETLKYRDRDTP
ncbi:DUF4234 domain-containing protein [Geoglobus acetivorans]|uniref:DUF4234 domain-containing protein n=1 Tax=Geoglobus acetivorans TaxID=565033 RepID=A0ABZ3H3R3_GEOAI|nr:DUF4234 domain-containing protein [Geoglobus acetivorans]